MIRQDVFRIASFLPQCWTFAVYRDRELIFSSVTLYIEIDSWTFHLWLCIQRSRAEPTLCNSVYRDWGPNVSSMTLYTENESWIFPLWLCIKRSRACCLFYDSVYRDRELNHSSVSFETIPVQGSGLKRSWCPIVFLTRTCKRGTISVAVPDAMSTHTQAWST